MKDQLHSMRLSLDRVAQEVDAIDSGTNESTPLYEAKKSVLLGKAWLGKCIGEVGGKTPYQNDGKRKNVEDIEPTDAQATEVDRELDKRNNIERADDARQDLASIYDEVWDITKHKNDGSRKFNIFSTNALNCISEARFHLGFELGRIREEHNFGTEGTDQEG